MIVRAPEFKYLITKYLQPFIVPTPWQLHPYSSQRTFIFKIMKLHCVFWERSQHNALKVHLCPCKL